MSYDAMIVGAGPAGAALSLFLARQGRSVLLVDGASFPREKVCGEGIMPHGVKALQELGLFDKIADKGQFFHGIRYMFKGKSSAKSARAHFPPEDDQVSRGFAVRRWILDEALISACQDHPSIDLRLSTFVREMEWLEGLPCLELAGERITAPILIGADGTRSFVRKFAKLEAKRPKSRRWAVRGHFQHQARDWQQPLVEVLLENHCELYLTPVDPNVTGVIMTLEDEQIGRIQGRPELGLRETLKMSHHKFCRQLAEAPALSKVQSTGPLGMPARNSFREHVLLVGDAAGALDPITGEGISLAFKMAKLAAKVLEECYRDNDFSAARLKVFEQRRRRMTRDLRALTKLVLFLGRQPRLASYVIGNLAKKPDTFQNLLGISAGSRSLLSLSWRDGLGLALGL